MFVSCVLVICRFGSCVGLVLVLFCVGLLLVFLLMFCVGLLLVFLFCVGLPLVFLFYDSGFASCVLVL